MNKTVCMIIQKWIITSIAGTQTICTKSFVSNLSPHLKMSDIYYPANNFFFKNRFNQNQKITCKLCGIDTSPLNIKKDIIVPFQMPEDNSCRKS